MAFSLRSSNIRRLDRLLPTTQAETISETQIILIYVFYDFINFIFDIF
jgi:hypothetical protein